MITALVKLSPIFLFGFIGWLLRNKNIVDVKMPSRLLKFGFFALAPFIVFQAMASVQWERSLLAYPIFAIFMGACGFLAGKLIISKYDFDELRKPVVLMSSMFVNIPFALTFLIARYSTEANTRVIIFNLINMPIVYGIGHFLAARSNPHAHNEKPIFKKLLMSTPLWGLIVGLIVSFTTFTIPNSIDKAFDLLAIFVVIIAALAIGMCINITRSDLKESFIAIATRYVTGILIAIAVVLICGFEGLDRAVVLTIGVAPIGFSTLTFAHIEKLDEKFAANTLGIALVVSAVLASFVLVVFS